MGWIRRVSVAHAIGDGQAWKSYRCGAVCVCAGTVCTDVHVHESESEGSTKHGRAQRIQLLRLHRTSAVWFFGCALSDRGDFPVSKTSANSPCGCAFSSAIQVPR